MSLYVSSSEERETSDLWSDEEAGAFLTLTHETNRTVTCNHVFYPWSSFMFENWVAWTTGGAFLFCCFSGCVLTQTKHILDLSVNGTHKNKTSTSETFDNEQDVYQEFLLYSVRQTEADEDKRKLNTQCLQHSNTHIHTLRGHFTLSSRSKWCSYKVKM